MDLCEITSNRDTFAITTAAAHKSDREAWMLNALSSPFSRKLKDTNIAIDKNFPRALKHNIHESRIQLLESETERPEALIRAEIRVYDRSSFKTGLYVREVFRLCARSVCVVIKCWVDIVSTCFKLLC